MVEQDAKCSRLNLLRFAKRGKAEFHARKGPPLVTGMDKNVTKIGERSVDLHRYRCRRCHAMVDPDGGHGFVLRTPAPLDTVFWDTARGARCFGAGGGAIAARTSSSSWARWLALIALRAFASPTAACRKSRSRAVSRCASATASSSVAIRRSA